MYFKKKEKFTFANNINYKPLYAAGSSSKFPTWGVVLIVLLIALLMGWLFYHLKTKTKNNNIQKFGFRFY